MTTITESQWVNYFGFQRFPFDRPEAGNEEFARPEFLASCFIEPEAFDRALGQADAPISSLLFAARGTGKTACRVMMDFYCQTGSERLGQSSPSDPLYILSVPHIQLDNVRIHARQTSPNMNPPEILVEHHAIEIMRQAIPTFVKLIARHEELADRVRGLSKSEFEDLSFFIIFYAAYLTSLQKDFLRDLGVDEPPLNNNPIGFLRQHSTTSHDRQPSWEPILFQQRRGTSPVYHLERWAQLMRAIGIKATYVLVDGVDEVMESAEDPVYALYLIRSLLAHMRLIDRTPYLAFKFFLPSVMEPLIRTDPAFRPDRGFVIQRIHWDRADLINILRERLNALRRRDYEIRDATLAGFDTLCVPELRGGIENNLVQTAAGNPRYMMNLCAQMVTAHCSRDVSNQEDAFQLNRQDFISAVERVKSLYRSKFSNPDDLLSPDSENYEARSWNERAISSENEQNGSGKAEGQTLRVGNVIYDRYLVEKIINTEHSRVIKAQDERLKRYVAIKSPRVELYSLNADRLETLYRNLKNEAELLSKLHHPNIEQVLDIVQNPFGIVVEWIDGWSFKELLEDRIQLPVHDIVMFGIEIADALILAHREKIVHRDIQPSNIMLAMDQTAKLIDFEIAKEKSLEDSSTQEGTVYQQGTPKYSSPEQLNIVGTATDIFSLGVVLYEMLTFSKPYPSGNRLAQYDDNFPRPDQHEIPKPLYKILLKMLDGKFSKRPTAEVVKRDLQKCLRTLNPA